MGEANLAARLIPVAWLVLLALEGCNLAEVESTPPAYDATALPASPGSAGSGTFESDLPVIDETTPAPAQPPPGYQAYGDLLLESGASAAGGIAGEPLEIEVEFNAASAAGQVTEMRLASFYGSGCPGLDQRQAELKVAPWEPLLASRSFPITLALNWVGFHVTVQYRDEAGNLSPIYCRELSIEGMPAKAPEGSG